MTIVRETSSLSKTWPACKMPKKSQLYVLKALGINLRIEDLFDEEGLLLAKYQG